MLFVSETASTSHASLGNRLQRAERALAHPFARPELLAEALRHSSAASELRPSNERMEFLGDAVIELAVCEELFRRHPDRPEGELSPMKSAAVSRVACSAAAKRLGLLDLLELGPGMRARTRTSSSMGGNAFEAVVAAIYLDAGMPAARGFVLRHLGEAMDAAGASLHHHNFKSVLQDFAQAWLGGRALYEHGATRGPKHKPVFEAAALVGERRFSSAKAATKKQAEQEAAEVALHELRAEPEGLPKEATAQLQELLGGSADRGSESA